MARSGPLDFIPKWWPVAAAVAAMIAGSAVSKADTANLYKRVERIDNVGTVHEQQTRIGLEGRLARIEANQEVTNASLARIEARLK